MGWFEGLGFVVVVVLGIKCSLMTCGLDLLFRRGCVCCRKKYGDHRSSRGLNF